MSAQRSKQEAKAFAQRMLFDKKWKPDRAFMLDMIARYRPEDAPPEFVDQGQVLEWIKHVKDLKSRIGNDTDAQLAWSAYLFGLFIGKQRVTQHYATELKRGKAPSLGDLHSQINSDAHVRARALVKVKARELYEARRNDAPEAGHLARCDEVARELERLEIASIKGVTVARWVPNPNPARRGRPRNRA
jgi:hypothetical protein